MSLSVDLIDPTATYDSSYLYSFNITHNLNTMAEEAGIYKAMWRPEELNSLGEIVAGDIVDILFKGLKDLKKDRVKFEKLNPDNGWGDYDGLLEVVTAYLDACMTYPLAKIEVSR